MQTKVNADTCGCKCEQALRRGEEAVRRLHQEVHGAELTDARGPRERKSCTQEFFPGNMEIYNIGLLAEH